MGQYINHRKIFFAHSNKILVNFKGYSVKSVEMWSLWRAVLRVSACTATLASRAVSAHSKRCSVESRLCRLSRDSTHRLSPLSAIIAVFWSLMYRSFRVYSSVVIPLVWKKVSLFSGETTNFSHTRSIRLIVSKAFVTFGETRSPIALSLQTLSKALNARQSVLSLVLLSNDFRLNQTHYTIFSNWNFIII